MPLFAEVPERQSFPDKEEEILKWWEENDTFKESVRLSKGRKRWSFYDGPPFATGLPHYGHILAGTIKDIVCRYAHQTGHYVERRFGWDCHGLPVEFEIDKKLGITGREDVLKMGIDKYNAECRAIVMRYSKEWETTVKRVGRWIDFENDYKTMNLSFMETVWWVFGQLHAKELVYRGFKVMPYSCACNTPLSNFEVQQNYKTVDDPAVICAFPLKGEEAVHFIAWTTTPWTLPSNLALCVNPTMEYVRVKDVASGITYILMATRLVQLYPDLGNPKKKKEAEKKFVEVSRFAGSTLKGLQYEQPFSYFEHKRASGSFHVLTGDFVTDDAGTGIVHCAPAFGEEDYKVCLAHGVIQKGEALVCPLDANGRFTDEVPEFVGKFVKDADRDIIKHLKEQQKMVAVGKVTHSYPFCWRSDTPLIYRAVPGTFINVECLRDRLLANNDKTYWVPAFVKEKRFHNWLENARDWAVSRNRFWGTPIPMWVSDDGQEVVVISSIAQLEELSGTKNITDLHRDSIDHITIPSKQGKGDLKRVDEVFDCWFESGSMPYAQVHYPFENKEVFEESFPADFIAEGIDQTRGWFYTLMVLSTAIFDKPAFKNLICNGLVLAEDGRKMSKRLKNYPDPIHILNSYGADALRLYLINSPVVRADELRFKEAGVMQVLKDVFLPWYHAYRMFVQCATNFEAASGKPFARSQQTALASRNTMDRWILAAANGLVQFTRREMEAYRLYTVVPCLVEMIEQLTNWYIRMNKDRFSGGSGEDDRAASLCTLYEVLLILCRMMAPLTPFFVESQYQNLKLALPPSEQQGSIHFDMIPEPAAEAIDPEIEADVKIMQQVIVNGRAIRDRHNLSMRTPLPEVRLVHLEQRALDAIKRTESYIADELNVRTVQTALVQEVPELVTFKCLPNHKVLGQKFGKEYKKVTEDIKALKHEDLSAFMASGSLTLNGNTFGSDDLLVSLEYSGDKGQRDVEVCKDGDKQDGLVLLDTKPDGGMLDEATAREVCAKVQKMRKELSLRKSDEVDVFYSSACADSMLVKVLAEQRSYVEGRLGRPLLPASTMPNLAVPIAVETKEVRVQRLVDDQIAASTELLTLTLSRSCAYFAERALARLLPDATVRDGARALVQYKDLAALRAQMGAEGGTLKVTLDRTPVALTYGTHFFLGSAEAAKAGVV